LKEEEKRKMRSTPVGAMGAAVCWRIGGKVFVRVVGETFSFFK
jgi:hypothetical protein